MTQQGAVKRQKQLHGCNIWSVSGPSVFPDSLGLHFAAQFYEKTTITELQFNGNKIYPLTPLKLTTQHVVACLTHGCINRTGYLRWSVLLLTHGIAAKKICGQPL